MRIPEQGWSRERVFAQLESYRDGDMPWRDGRTWAYIYDPGREAEQVIKDAFSSYLTENGLDPTVFPSSLRMENEVVAMAAAHLSGDEHVVGSFTSGGTESILLAVKAARDWAREHRPEIAEPEILLPETAHAAFQKAAYYLGLKPVLVPVDATSFRADPDAIRNAITPSTILVVGSAISYAHGVVDPIRELGQIALERELLLHVDGCMGAFLLPYFRRLGAKLPDFDFGVPGVTSISMDLHKYAFAAKGASTILYRSKALRKYQMYACSNWTGYTVINPTVQSTKSAGPIAAA
jgi:glutamate/tyrosine decarboxylase-like PLP-dependent enzyme